MYIDCEKIKDEIEKLGHSVININYHAYDYKTVIGDVFITRRIYILARDTIGTTFELFIENEFNEGEEESIAKKFCKELKSSLKNIA